MGSFNSAPSIQKLMALCTLVFVAGCFDVGGKDFNRVENRTEYTASGHSIEGCQENLDQMAGTHVTMTLHAGSLLLYT